MKTRILRRHALPSLVAMTLLCAPVRLAAAEPPPPAEVLADMIAFVRDTARRDLYDRFAAHVVDPEGTADTNRMQRATLRSLAQFGAPAIPALLEFMPLPNHWNGPVARRALAQVGAPAVPALVEVFKDDDQARTEAATDALRLMTQHAVPWLLPYLRHEHPGIRAGVSGAIARIVRERRTAFKPDELQAVTAELLRLLDDPAPKVRAAATEAIGVSRTSDGAAVLRLVGLLADADETVQWQAAQALANVGPLAVAPLTEALRAPAPASRRYAAFALAKIGTAAAEAVPALVTALRDAESVVRANAADALGRVGDAAVLEALQAALNDPEVGVQVEAAAALAAVAGDDPAIRQTLDEWRARRAQAAMPVTHRPAEHTDGGLFPATIPGYPGALPPAAEDAEQRPVWGHPQRLPYPGSVEHIRSAYIAYFPGHLPWNAGSLVRLWQAPRVPGLGAAESWAEPIVYCPRYGRVRNTGETRPPVAVQRWRPGSSMALDFGRLPPSTYVVRVVAAVATEDAPSFPKQLIMRFAVNDGRDGEVRVFTRRLRAVDNFYSMAEWYFHAHDDREFRVELTLLPETEMDLLVHTVDLHDHFAFLAQRRGKREPTLFPLAERETARALRRAEPSYRAPVNTPLTVEERRREDARIWAQMPEMNSQFHTCRNPMPVPPPAEVEALRAAGVEDPGWGVFLPESRTYHAPLARANDAARRAMVSTVTGASGGAHAYYLNDDRRAARRAAMELVRIASVMPTWDGRQALGNVVLDESAGFGLGQEIALRRRNMFRSTAENSFVEPYDKLFDFIDGNEELAVAVSRFLPDIRTSGDLLRFLDTALLQFPARQIENYQLKTDHGTPAMMLALATAQQDREITRPWMEYLFSRTFIYPMPLSGIQDYLNTGTTRDGTTWIGSWFYAAGGGRGLQIAPLLRRSIEVGGDPRYDIVEPREYPKVLTSSTWSLENRMAGTFPLLIGDVGGPTVSHLHWFDSGKEAMRRGWEWLRDKRFAYFLAHYFGRATETDEQWAAIEQAAAEVPRHPWFTNRSRVFSQWAGILEGGTQHDDFRLRRAVAVRVGLGHGHAHDDALDLTLVAHGCILAADGGQRPAYGVPSASSALTHNLVVAPGRGSYGWVRTLADAPGAAYLAAETVPSGADGGVQLYRRQVAMIDVQEGTPSTTPITPDMHNRKLPPDIVPAQLYVFDVFRVSGGQRHTYAFHGGQNDEFTHNAREVVSVPMPPADAERTPVQEILRQFWMAPERHWQGVAPARLQADWRLSREERELPVNNREAYTRKLGGYGAGQLFAETFTVSAAERANLGASFDADAPRKGTHLHLFGEEGTRVFGGMWASPKSRHAFDQLFVQREAPDGQGLESAFVAVIEPYAGEPAIRSVEPLPVTDNEADAQRAVAIEVLTGNGHRDLCFSDGRPERERRIGDATVAAEFAHVSRDAQGLRRATIVGGTLLKTPEIEVRLNAPSQSATVVAVDYIERRLQLSHPLGGTRMAGAFAEIGNQARRTSIDIEWIDGTMLRYGKSPEIVTTRVMAFDPETGIALTRLGMPPGEGRVAGLDAGLTAANHDRSQLFRCDFLGGSREEGYRFQLAPAPTTPRTQPTAAAFPELGTLRIFEFGPGDEVRVTSHASLQRLADGLFELRANVALSLVLPDAELEVSNDRRTWRPLAAGAIAAADLGTDGTLYLRIRRHE